MPPWNDFLERFRPAGTPGAAARPGVPADRSQDAAAELTPLLLLLDDVQDEADHIRRAAVERADEIRRAAQREADLTVARAREDAQDVRAEAKAAAELSAGAAWADRRADNAEEIERLRERVAERMPEYVGKVVSLVRHWLEEPAVPRR